MSNADKSASGRIRQLKARTLAVYHKNNPTLNDFGGVKPSNALTLLLRSVGTTSGADAVCTTCACEEVCDLSGALILPLPVADIPEIEATLSASAGETVTIPAPPEGYPDERIAVFFLIPVVCNATTYTTTLNIDSDVLPQTQHFLGIYTLTDFFINGTFALVVSYPSEDYGSFTATATASNACSTTSVEAEFGCFLAGSPVAMADGSFKAIEAVEIGDVVRGAFGEPNAVLALHRPILGAGYVININGEHKTTAHHPHIAADKKFACVEPDILNGFTYGKEHTVIVNKAGRKERRLMSGVDKRRITKMAVGTELQTLTGPRAVASLERVPMSPLTPVYHLVVNGSHTYIVNGYAVTGWAREDDFDYDVWSPR
jgi:hypothetical protein